MNIDSLRAVADLIEAVQKAEGSTGLFLDGGCDLVDCDGNILGCVGLNGTTEHEFDTTSA